ncbi:hypothetical protein FB45DRAFT_1042839 [Roridomyces roridus]|uniref:Uncharacterized protein n=1 Tax=Roridomyces roridus TaxID=1738132 RepID=A0AAD7AZ42_9AGAR|nr:hypothetical protein FB45DRAFT_1042839 [Roridomyces roridus]
MKVEATEATIPSPTKQAKIEAAESTLPPKRAKIPLFADDPHDRRDDPDYDAYMATIIKMCEEEEDRSIPSTRSPPDTDPDWLWLLEMTRRRMEGPKLTLHSTTIFTPELAPFASNSTYSVRHLRGPWARKRKQGSPDLQVLWSLGVVLPPNIERRQNIEELREKARERMQRCVMLSALNPLTLTYPILSRLRDKRKDDLEDLEEHHARARESSRKYRQAHSSALAHRQRIRRMDAFEKKHGHVAWSERSAKLEEQRRVAAEEEEWHLYEAELKLRWKDNAAVAG